MGHSVNELQHLLQPATWGRRARAGSSPRPSRQPQRGRAGACWQLNRYSHMHSCFLSTVVRSVHVVHVGSWLVDGPARQSYICSMPEIPPKGLIIC
eukprot:SAG22_NODE_1657_length_3885_cov_6.187005_4_plen_96_part_00